MDIYPYALLLHIVGALGVFVGLGLQWLAVGRMRGAMTRTELSTWMSVMTTPRVIAPVSMLTLLITGLYMAVTQWRMDSWPGAGLLGLIVLALVGALMTGRTMIQLGRMLESEQETLAPRVRSLLAELTLPLALWIQTGLALGIVTVMVLKPDFVTSIAILAIGAVIGGLIASAGGTTRSPMARGAGTSDGEARAAG
jgi:hypothetical protein